MNGPKVSKSVVTKVTKTVRYEFTHAELCKRLRLPETALIFVTVPGGGDWSNTDLEIGRSTPLRAEVVTGSEAAR
jgi:hypothetical protein